jgi:hypothetical protein
MDGIEKIAIALMFFLSLAPAAAALLLAFCLHRSAVRKAKTLTRAARLMLLVVITASFALPVAFVTYINEPRGIVVYDDFYLSGQGRFLGGGQYRDLVVGTSSTSLWALNEDILAPNDLVRLPDFYIRLPDSKILLLRDLTPLVAMQYWERVPPKDNAKYPYLRFYSGFGSRMEGTLVFDGELLIAAEFDGRDIQIGRSESGPFFSFPLKYREMVSLFGEPNSIFQRHFGL